MDVLNSKNAPGAIGPYVQAIEVNGFVYTSGQLGIDVTTGELAKNIEEQTNCSLKNIMAILKERNLTLADVVKTTVFLKDLDDFSVVNNIYKEYFKDHYPARSCVQVAKLPMNGLVEIEVVAVAN